MTIEQLNTVKEAFAKKNKLEKALSKLKDIHRLAEENKSWWPCIDVDHSVCLACLLDEKEFTDVLNYITQKVQEKYDKYIVICSDYILSKKVE